MDVIVYKSVLRLSENEGLKVGHDEKGGGEGAEDDEVEPVSKISSVVLKSLAILLHPQVAASPATPALLLTLPILANLLLIAIYQKIDFLVATFVVLPLPPILWRILLLNHLVITSLDLPDPI